MKLTQEQVSHFVSLPLHGLTREYPNHIMHLMQSDADAQTPRQLHPVFYGCYDWHSAVHGFWLLARCLQLFPRLPENPAVCELFESHFTTISFEHEAAYFDAPGRASFERPYGWGWALALANMLEKSALPEAKRWRHAMQPLVQVVRERFLNFLPKLSYPIRVGTHFNTAFALILAYDYARDAQDEILAGAIQTAGLRYYAHDTNYPAKIEPNGDDFLSGALCEALLMSRLLSEQEFATWFTAFLPNLPVLSNLLVPATVSDRSDPKIAHLDGLNLSRAWCMRRIARALPENHPAQALLKTGAERHLTASLPHVASGDYVGEHWLATFAMLALDE